MWTFLQDVMKNYGVLGMFAILEAVALYFMYRLVESKEKTIRELQETVHQLNEKRLEDAQERLGDVVEDRERYEDLAKELTSNLDVLIKMLPKGRNGTNSN